MGLADAYNAGSILPYLVGCLVSGASCGPISFWFTVYSEPDYEEVSLTHCYSLESEGLSL